VPSGPELERVAADVHPDLAAFLRREAGKRQSATAERTSVAALVVEALDQWRARLLAPPPEPEPVSKETPRAKETRSR
jgi:hypothetical protein